MSSGPLAALIDTQALLWWLADDERLPAGARELMADPTVTLHHSAATVSEIAIKRALGKLRVPDDLPDQLSEAGFRELPVSGTHAWAAGALPAHHRDPFDRMIAAQARVERLAVVTGDRWFAAYGVRTIW